MRHQLTNYIVRLSLTGKTQLILPHFKFRAEVPCMSQAMYKPCETNSKQILTNWNQVQSSWHHIQWVKDSHNWMKRGGKYMVKCLWWQCGVVRARPPQWFLKADFGMTFGVNQLNFSPCWTPWYHQYKVAYAIVRICTCALVCLHLSIITLPNASGTLCFFDTVA